MGYDKQLFLLQQDNVDLTGLTVFSSSVLHAWLILRTAHDNNEIPDVDF